MNDILPPKRQAVVDRLRRRIENYRRRQTDSIPRFDQSFNGLCEQNIQDTLVLKQRHFESKAKRAAKKTDKKQDNLQGVHSQSKFNKRPLEEEPSENPFESSVKHPCPGPGGQHPNQGQQRPSANNQQQQQQQQQQSTENNLKFSVEIVQQLEFTTSTANNQTQQISANVTVKATSVKNDVSTTSSAASSPQSRGGGATPSAPQPPPPPGPGGDLVECKMEPEFVDLAHCTLDKDGHFNGDAFPNLTDFTFDDATDDFDSVKLTDLFSEITDLHPDIIKEFGFDDHKGAGSLMDGLGGLRGGNFKMEDDVKDFNPHPSSGLSDVLNKPGQQQQHSPSPHVGAQYSPRVGAYPPGLTDHGSPAAQTLKQMAEQHQHKTQLGISPFNPARSPYEYQGGGEYLGSPGAAPAGSPYLKQGTAGGGSFVNNTAQSEMVKQEGGMSFSASQQQAFSAELHKRQQHQAALHQQQQQLQQQQQQQANKAGATQGGGASGYPGGKQQYSYGGSPGGSPQYRGGGGGPQLGQFGRSTPPRPPSCPGPGLQVNQGQHVHVAQQGSNVQVSAGQHMQLSAADMKPGVNVQVSANQGLYFSQQTSPPESCYTVSQSQTINFTQQSMRQRPQQTRPAGVVESSLVAQQHATLLQQQQILRAQHQQQQQAAAAAQQHLMGPGPRGPPPEYKPSPQLIHGLMGQQQRFAVAGSRQRTQQPMPASGPMMRPQQQNQALHGGGSMFMPGMPGMGTQHHSMAPQHRLPGYARPTPNTRPPNVAIGQDGMGRGVPGDWRHVFMSQQQQQGVMYSNPQMRANYQHQGGQFSVQGGHQMSAAAVQMQQMNRSPVNQMQMLTQQQQVAMGLSQQGPGPTGPTPNQMSMNMQMNQAMSVSGGGGSPHPHHHPSNNPQQQSVGYTGSPGPAPTTPSSSIPAEFSLELLDNFPTGGDSSDLFLDPGAAFNLHDIL